MARANAVPQSNAINWRTLAWCALFATLLLTVVVSGLKTVAAAHEMRGLYGSMAEVQREQDRLLEQHSRLMLERGTLGSMQNIETFAQTELGMEFPEQVGEILQ